MAAFFKVRHLTPNVHANTYAAPRMNYTFFEGRASAVELPEDVEFFRGRSDTFEEVESDKAEEHRVIRSVAEYDEFVGKKPENEEKMVPFEEQDKSKPELEPGKTVEGEDYEEPEEFPEAEAKASVDDVKAKARELKAKDFLAWIKDKFGIKAKSEKSAIKQFEEKYGGKK